MLRIHLWEGKNPWKGKIENFSWDFISKHNRYHFVVFLFYFIPTIISFLLFSNTLKDWSVVAWAWRVVKPVLQAQEAYKLLVRLALFVTLSRFFLCHSTQGLQDTSVCTLSHRNRKCIRMDCWGLRSHHPFFQGKNLQKKDR